MSSITSQKFPAFKRAFIELGMRLQQELEFCRRSTVSGLVIQETIWMQFQQDVKSVNQAIQQLAEVLEEEWSNAQKLQTFIKNLEMMNTDLFEENNQNISKLEQSENQRSELIKIIDELNKTLENQQIAIPLRKSIAHSNNIKFQETTKTKDNKENCSKSSHNNTSGLQLCNFEEELQLKNSELQLAMLVIEDLRSDKQCLMSLINSAYNQKCSINTLNSPLNSLKSIDQSVSNHKNARTKRSSLLDDLTESQIIYQPHIDSKMLKSAETIQQTVEDNHQTSHIRLASRFDPFRKVSKAVSVRISTEVSDASTQTIQQQSSWLTKEYQILKNRVVSKRIKRFK